MTNSPKTISPPFDLPGNPLWKRILARAKAETPFAQALDRWLTDPGASTVFLRDQLCRPCQADDDLAHFNQFAQIDSAIHNWRTGITSLSN